MVLVRSRLAVLIVALAIGIGTYASAQVPDRAFSAAAAKLREAYDARDVTAVDQLLAPNFESKSQHGARLSRAEFIQGLKDFFAQLTGLHIAEDSVAVHSSQTTAETSSTWTYVEDYKYRGKTYQAQLREKATRTWSLTATGWKLAHFQILETARRGSDGKWQEREGTEKSKPMEIGHGVGPSPAAPIQKILARVAKCYAKRDLQETFVDLADDYYSVDYTGVRRNRTESIQAMKTSLARFRSVDRQANYRLETWTPTTAEVTSATTLDTTIFYGGRLHRFVLRQKGKNWWKKVGSAWKLAHSLTLTNEYADAKWQWHAYGKAADTKPQSGTKIY